MSDTPIASRPYRPAMACERCVWGRGLHRDDCPEGVTGTAADFIDWNQCQTWGPSQVEALFGQHYVPPESPIAPVDARDLPVVTDIDHVTKAFTITGKRSQ